MVEQNDLVERLKQYDSFLTRSLEDERTVMGGKDMLVSLATDQRQGVYRAVQQELYRLCPEIKPE